METHKADYCIIHGGTCPGTFDKDPAKYAKIAEDEVVPVIK